MLILVKAIVSAALLGMIGLMVGPFLGLMLISTPPDACGLAWIIPAGIGAAVTGCGAALVGFALGLFA